MGHAIIYKNIESDVTAYQLSSATTNEIGAILCRQLAAGLIANVQAIPNNTTGCHTFRFRYKDESTDSVLNEGDYLVLRNTGKYVAYAKDVFEAEYINTSNDITPIQPTHVLDMFISKMNSTFTDLNFTSRDDCLSRIYQAVEKLRMWYDTNNNILTFTFTNYAMVSPKDINKILSPFTKASYCNETTKFTLNFNNIGPISRNIRDLDGAHINSFNLIALQELIAELRLTDKSIRERITGMSFIGTNSAPSAIATSVTEGQWLDIIDDIREITGIERNSAITR